MLISKFVRRAKAWVARKRNMVEYCRSLGMRIGERSLINGSVNIGSEPYLITIGRHCEVTGAVNLITHDGGVWVFREQHPDWDVMGPIVLKDNVYVGYGATIMPNVTLGPNTVVGAGAVVTKSFPGNQVICGIPAREIKSLSDYYASCSARAIKTKHLSAAAKKQAVIQIIKEMKDET